jgi:tetratricopeptide (TPR) repeat protein
MENPEIRSGLTGHSLAWTMSGVVAANWHPVTNLSFVLGHQFWGNNTGAEHLVNALIHALNAVLLFLVLNQMTSAPGQMETRCRGSWLTGRSALPDWRSAVVAALFAWHPLRVESVAWIAERKDVLSVFFMMLMLLAYTRHAQKKPSGVWRPASWDYWLALVFFALGLMSKAMLVTLPFVLLLLDVWPLRRISDWGVRSPELKKRNAPRPSIFKSQLSPLLVEKWPFFALAVAFSVITFVVQRGEAATPSLAQLSLGLRLENIIVSYFRYLAWTIWPANLAAYYSFPFDNHFYLALWPDWVVGAAALLLAGVSALCFSQIVRRPFLAVGWFWYLGTMVPVIGLVQVGGQGMADRYTYIPLIGPVISLVWLVSEKWPARVFPRALLTTLTAAILIGCLVQTRHQLQFWKNTETLSRHTIEVTGENPRAEYILGLGLERQGDIDGAMIHYRNAVTSQPRITEAFYALGRLFAQQGRWAEAEKTYSTMLTDDPNDFTCHLGLANVLPHLGRLPEAVTQLKAAMQTCPDTPDALNNLAWTLAASGETELRDGAQAVKNAERACELTHYRETMMVGTLAAAYAEAGRFDDAISTAQKACALASESGQQELLEKNQELLGLYRSHQAYREAANPNASDQSATNRPPDSIPR